MNPTPHETTPHPAPRSSAPRRLILAAAMLLVVAAAAGFLYFRSQESRYAQDEYLQANELYKQAFLDYQRGGLPDYRAARGKLIQALEMQRNPAGNQDKTALPVRPNALTHNVSGLLAILSALLGECGEYDKYSELTTRIADAKWSIDVMNEVQQQVNDEEKAQLVFSAGQQIREAGLRCKQHGLPVKSFGDSTVE